MIMLTLGGCCRKTAAPPTVSVHDTVYQTMVQHDSVYTDRWHTHCIYVNGDTVRLVDTFWCDRYKERLVHDTTYLSQEVQVPYAVEKPLTYWQQLLLKAGRVTVAAVVLLMLYEACRLWRRRLR